MSTSQGSKVILFEIPLKIHHFHVLRLSHYCLLYVCRLESWIRIANFEFCGFSLCLAHNDLQSAIFDTMFYAEATFRTFE
jgi:hypothetical protein